MTVKELINKVNAHNEVAKMLGNEQIDLGIDFRFSYLMIDDFQDDIKKYGYKHYSFELLEKRVHEEFVDGAAKAILGFNGYILNNKCYVVANNGIGGIYEEEITIYA